MADVAKAAGVSHQTVSRVLNAHPNVSPATKEQVEKAIADLGYRRNTAARSLVTRQSQTIGVLASELTQYGPANTLLGVEQAAREAGYFVSIAALRTEVSAATINDALGRFMDQGVDGVVVVVPHPGTLDVLRGLSVDVPLVAVGASGDEWFKGVAVDQHQGGRLAVEHLLELGHRRIGHLSGPADWIDATSRIEAWRDALAAAGLGESVLMEGDWSAESGYRAGLRLAGRRPAGELDCTALFVANDQMALGVLRAFYEAGISVPGDVSIVGYDDQPDAPYLIPPLTTVTQHFEELGRRCINALLEAFEGAGVRAGVVEPELVVRSTTAPPAG
ncbi:LacI family DNA-binding transcriptional regulator [Arthrobacter castelli]|uniref:LacI family DNA-binding transcriptional regulator n=1 Tax=Arthrobacter castelli TaxID=271431 RepID=UPI0004191037|nr:LacI family DNA-binding transcriptional regulator [Arthrobacter castelli]